MYTAIITGKVVVNQIFTFQGRLLVFGEWQSSEWAQCIWYPSLGVQSAWWPKISLVAKRGGCLFSAYDSFPIQPPINPPAIRYHNVEWLIMHPWRVPSKLHHPIENGLRNQFCSLDESTQMPESWYFSSSRLRCRPFPPYWSCLPAAAAADQLTVVGCNAVLPSTCPDKARPVATTAYNKRLRSDWGE